MDRRTMIITAPSTTSCVATIALAVLLVLGYAFDWFGGDAEAPAPTSGADGTTQ